MEREREREREREGDEDDGDGHRGDLAGLGSGWLFGDVNE